MIVCIPVTADGQVAEGWGRARRVALVTVHDDAVVGWHETEVRWDALRDEGTGGAHHARVARFLIDGQVDAVVAGHLGEGMSRMLGKLGIRISLGAHGDARAAVLAAADRLR